MAHVLTIEENVTATHPPVMPLKPVRTGRPHVRIPAPEAVSVTPETTAPPSEPFKPDPERAAATTRSVLSGVLLALRICGVVALVMVAYFAWTQNWIGNTADAAVAWYSANVVPYLEVDLVGPEVPTVQDGLVGPINEQSLVTTD